MSSVIWPNPPKGFGGQPSRRCKACGITPEEGCCCPPTQPPKKKDEQHIVIPQQVIDSITESVVKEYVPAAIAKSKIAKALLVICKTDAIRLWLRQNDNTALEQAISALEAEVPGILGELTDQALEGWLEGF